MLIFPATQFYEKGNRLFALFYFNLCCLAVGMVICMKDVLEILEGLEPSKKIEVLDYLLQLKEDYALLKDEQRDLLNSLDTLYKRNQKLHQKLEKLESKPSGKKLMELAEENQKLQNALDNVLALLDI